MAELLDQVRELKARARAFQDAGDSEVAAKALSQAIAALEPVLVRSDDEGAAEPATGLADAGGVTAAAAQLADLYGMLGGTLRREGNYREAAAAYDRGFEIESDPRYAVQSTYNALNRLTTRILLRPSCLADPGVLHLEESVVFVDVPHELAELRNQLLGQVAGVRAGDFWAAGDLSVTCALTGDEAGMSRGLEEFARLSPPPSAFDAIRQSIKALARLDTTRKGSLLVAERSWSRRATAP